MPAVNTAKSRCRIWSGRSTRWSVGFPHTLQLSIFWPLGTANPPVCCALELNTTRRNRAGDGEAVRVRVASQQVALCVVVGYARCGPVEGLVQSILSDVDEVVDVAGTADRDRAVVDEGERLVVIDVGSFRSLVDRVEVL